MLLLSRNKIVSNNCFECQGSFINIQNRRGSSTDPCGTQQITFLYSVLLRNILSSVV